MKRPEKIDIEHNDDCQCKSCHLQSGYNQACDDWGKFLPDEEEILDILYKNSTDRNRWIVEVEKGKSALVYLTQYVSETISNRLKGVK